MLDVTHYEIKVRREPYTDEEKREQMERLEQLAKQYPDRDYFNIWKAPEGSSHVMQIDTHRTKS